jgi:GAF domain-containing protein
VRIFPRRLGPKLNLSLLVFLVLLGAATASLVLLGFRRTQHNATKTSREGLETQARQTLGIVTQMQAGFGQAQLEATAGFGQQAARYMIDARTIVNPTAWDPSRLARSPQGDTYDPDPRRVTSVYVPGILPVDEKVLRDLRDSAVLDAVFPSILAGYSGDTRSPNFDAVAIYFNSVNGVTRYFPALPIEQLTPNADPRKMVAAEGPAANPQRATQWTAPYADKTGRGQVITATIPVYDGDEYRGIIGMDVTLTNLAAQIDLVKPSPNGYAFYLDRRGALFHTASFATVQSAIDDPTNTGFAGVIASMKGGETNVGRAEVNGQEVFVAYAPIGGVGGSFALVAPIADVTQQASLVANGIDDQGNRTVAFVLTTMVIFFGVALAGAAWLNRRTILRPIDEMVTGTRAVAAGNLVARIPVRSSDELGMLADSFNVMTGEVREARELLEQRVDERTRELTTLLNVSQSVASKIELGPLLAALLSELGNVVDYYAVSVMMREGDELVLLDVASDIGGSVDNPYTGQRFPARGAIWAAMERGESVVIADVWDETDPWARRYRNVMDAVPSAAEFVRGVKSWLSVPLAAQDRVVGSLAIASGVVGYFTPERTRLVRGIASQAAVAVVNARLFEETQLRTRELTTLLDVARDVASTLELQPLLQLILQQVHPMASFDRAAIMLCDGDVLRVEAIHAPIGSDADELETLGATYPIGGVLWDEISQGRRVIIDDVRADTQFARAYRRITGIPLETLWKDTRSWMGVPVVLKDEVIGMMVMSHSESAHYTDRHAQLATVIASQAAVAIENARLFEETQQGAREMSALLDVSHAVASRLDREGLANLVLDQLKKIIDYTGSSVVLLDGDALTIFASRSPSGASTNDMRIPLDGSAGLWNEILLLKPILIDDIRSDERLAVQYRRAIGGALETPGFNEIRSWMAVPLAPKDEPIGMLTMSRTEPGYFTARHARLARAVADQAAIAIENARLFEEAQRRAREIEALFRADEQLFQSLSLDAVFQALVDVCVDVLGVPKSMVTTIDDAAGHYTIRASRNLSQWSLDTMAEIRSRTPRAVLAGISETIVNIDVRSSMPEMHSVFDREGIYTTVDVPIKSTGTLRGVLGAAYTSKRALTPAELRLLQALAERAAVAIDNAELYERAQQVASLEERQKLARELHDSVSQALYGIALGARTARTLLDRNPKDAIEPVDYVLSLAEAGLTEMRALIFELRPESLETEGLVAAIEKNVAATQARYGIEVAADLCPEPNAPLDVKEAAYRIAQEALHNIVKHAHASHVDIRLAQEDSTLVLEVRDNGVGFDASGAFPGHIGLRSMRERTSKGGGMIEIDSGPGRGTRITARLSL